MIKVDNRNTRGLEIAIKRFMKESADVIKQLRKKEYAVSKGQKKRLKSIEAQKRVKKIERQKTERDKDQIYLKYKIKTITTSINIITELFMIIVR